MAAGIPIATQIIAAALVGSFQVTGIAATLIMGGAALLGGYLASRLTKVKEAEPDFRANYVSTNKTIPVLYGTRLTGSNDVYIAIGKSGESSSGGGGKYLWIVSTLCEGEIDGYNSITVDGKEQLEIYVNGDGIWEKSNKGAKFWLYTGTNDQTKIGGSGLEKLHWGTKREHDDTYINTAFMIWRFPRKNKNFQGVPRREVGIKGVKCLDVRTPLDPKTWTDNPALILYDYLTNTRYGLGWDQERFDLPSFEEAATYCDDYGWKFDYTILSQRGAQSIIDLILAHFRGFLKWWDGKIILDYVDLREEFPLFDIGDNVIARDPSGKALVRVSQPTKFNIPDGVLVAYMNSRNNWTIDHVPIGESRGQVKTIEFSGYTRRELALEMGTYTLERQLMNRTYNLVLHPSTVELGINDVITMSISEIGMTDQLARVKSSTIGGDGSINLTAILEKEELYDKEFQPDSSEVYSVAFPGVGEIPPPVTNIVVTEEIYYYRERSFVRLNVTFDEPEDYPYFSHVDVYVSFAPGFGLNTWNNLAPIPDTWNDLTLGSATWDNVMPLPGTWNDHVPVPKTWNDLALLVTWEDLTQNLEEDDYKLLMSASDSFQVDPVEENATYYLKFVSVSTFGVRQEFTDAPQINHTVLGVSKEYAPNPSYFWSVQNQTSVDLTSTKFNSPDISGYEMRLSSTNVTPGETWGGSIFLSFRSSPDVSYSGVKPGVHKFWLSPRHKNQNYCLNPATTVVELEDPPPGSYNTFTEVLDYADIGATIDNLIIAGTYPNQTLSVDHSTVSPGDPLYGYFLSDVIDTDPDGANSDGTSLAYLLFQFTQNALAAATWDNIAPIPTTWNDFAYPPVTWEDLYGDDNQTAKEAARVDVSFEYSNSSTGPFEVVNRMELLSAIIEGRYVKVKIEITDVVESRYINIGPATLKAGYLESVELIGA
jgi:hypothetical protein